jgi:hypothetical protein
MQLRQVHIISGQEIIQHFAGAAEQEVSSSM